MEFRQLQATFGKLERRALVFSPGFNVIEAANESGKSTLTAFLCAMLYGLKTGERGALADKNRYAPWSGSAMQGTLALSSAAFGDVTIQRETVRVNAPMGRFSAVFTGTGEPVAALTAADCGETLLGVPRAVYERSAFIRQSGLPVDQDAELERRIAALITTGEEGASYSEAAATLRRAINKRRANARSGAIPALEREIEADEAALAELDRLSARQAEAEDALAALRDEDASLRAALAAHDLADRQAAQAERLRAQREADEADARAEVVYRMIADAKTPEKETLAQKKSALHALGALREKQEGAAQHSAKARRALEEHEALPRPKHQWIVLALAALLLAALTPVLRAAFPSAPVPYIAYLPLAAGLALLVPAVLLRCSEMRARRAYEDRGRTLSAALREAETGAQALEEAARAQLAAVLDGIPAGDAAHAQAYLDEALARYDMLSQLERDAQEKRMRSELLQREPLSDVPEEPVERPALSRAALEEALAANGSRGAELRREADLAAARRLALGDAGELGAGLAEKRDRLAALREEYDAAALAADALDRANAALQTRFAPELGKRAAAYFSALTDGKYDRLLLDRSFRALAGETGDAVTHEAALLSQGASDQLYLAVRLAICDMVLPPAEPLPLVLDDALINFDDARCAAALELLLRTAETRQVLLFTCQHREAAYLAGRDNVSILTL